ncbi:hypothetical protein D5086_013685 [Populus alba]|uniref:Uncharacterized protein n=1 Tax=Populus alba TaxID=43335 RepID=A0ACC4C783_POPAL
MTSSTNQRVFLVRKLNASRKFRRLGSCNSRLLLSCLTFEHLRVETIGTDSTDCCWGTQNVLGNRILVDADAIILGRYTAKFSVHRWAGNGGPNSRLDVAPSRNGKVGGGGFIHREGPP